MTADGPPAPDAAIDDVLRDVTFVDASALVALADRDDASHAAAVAAYQDLVASGFHLFTTDLALASAHEMIAVALGQEVARSWLAHCNILVQRIAPADLEEGRRAIEEGWSAPRPRSRTRFISPCSTVSVSPTSSPWTERFLRCSGNTLWPLAQCAWRGVSVVAGAVLPHPTHGARVGEERASCL